MKISNLKKNLFIKQFASFFHENEIVLFIHPTKEMSFIKNSFFFYNGLKLAYVKASLLCKFFKISKKSFFFSKVYGLVFFKTFYDFFLFFNYFLQNKKNISLLLLFIFWGQRARFLSLNYLLYFVNLITNKNILIDNKLENSLYIYKLSVLFSIFSSINETFYLFFFFLNRITILTIYSCLQLDN